MPTSFWTQPFTSNKNKKVKWPTILKELRIFNWFDLLWLLPNKFQPIIDERDLLFNTEIRDGLLVRVKGKISHVFFRPVFYRKGKGPLLHHGFAKFTSNDKRWQIYAFNLYPNVKNKWKEWEDKEEIVLVGEYSTAKGLPSLLNPKEELSDESDDNKAEKLISYPKLKGISSIQWKNLQKELTTLPWENFPSLPKEFPLAQAFIHLHGIKPSTKQQEQNSLEVLKLYEFWCEQTLILEKKEKRQGITVPKVTLLPMEKVLALSPFTLTVEQSSTLKEIYKDFLNAYPMRRLLQGEVGSGKTILAFLSALAFIESSSAQVAFMAPTETLVRQHWDKWQIFFPQFLTKSKLLLSTASKKEREETLKQLQNGQCQFVLGTHALFQKDVIYQNLRYTIIDEQHRFGVDQRRTFYQKGHHPHVLMMSATPIPRTLGLTHFGDLDQSSMRQTPFGEKKIQTRLVEKDNYHHFLSFLKTRLTLGEQAYIVAPVIEESEHFTFHLKSLETFYRQNFPEFEIAILHGKLKDDEQFENFQRFQQGKAKILIATTMIEVGVDVANASVMAIYHPEQFGLSSLHQLRGRVGRGKKSGFCFLLSPQGLEQTARERLLLFEKTLDGFVLAEKDFTWRGQGNIWGIEQSGKLSPYKVASLPRDQDLLFDAYELAKKYFKKQAPLYPSHLGGESHDQVDYWL